MDRLVEAEKTKTVIELESKLRVAARREAQLREQLLFWRCNWFGVFFLCIGVYVLHVLFIDVMKAVNDVVAEHVEKERDKIADCVIPESERVYGNYLRCFPWLFEEEKKK